MDSAQIQALGQVAQRKCSVDSSCAVPELRRLIAHIHLLDAVDRALQQPPNYESTVSVAAGSGEEEIGPYHEQENRRMSSRPALQPYISERELDDDEEDEEEGDIAFEKHELTRFAYSETPSECSVGSTSEDLDEDSDDDDDEDDDYDDEDVDIFSKLRLLYNSQHPITHHAYVQRAHHIHAVAVATVQQSLQAKMEEQPLQPVCTPHTGLNNGLPTLAQSVIPA